MQFSHTFCPSLDIYLPPPLLVEQGVTKNREKLGPFCGIVYREEQRNMFLIIIT